MLSFYYFIVLLGQVYLLINNFYRVQYFNYINRLVSSRSCVGYSCEVETVP